MSKNRGYGFKQKGAKCKGDLHGMFFFTQKVVGDSNALPGLVVDQT